MAFDKDHWSRMATEAGLSAEQIEAIAANEKLMTQLAQGFKRQDEFSRSMDEAQRTKAEADQVKAQAAENYQRNLEWYNANAPKLTAYEQLMQQLGQPTGQPAANPAAQPEKKYLTQDELMAAQKNFYNLVARQLPRLHRSYRDTFGSEMPDELMDQIEAAATKPENAGRSANDLYTEIITPKIEEKRKADITAQIASAREQAFKEGMAKGRMREPSDSMAAEDTSPLYMGRPKDPAAVPDDRALMNNFLETLDRPVGVAANS